MKTAHLSKGLFFILLFLTVTIFSCKKGSLDTPPPATSLRLTVKDGLYPVSGAIVKLYLSETDLVKSTNQVGASKTTDASGEVTFTALQEQKYYWRVESGCKNNLNGVVSSTSPLSKGITNTATVSISSTGTIKLINTSSNPYDVYANGILVIDNMPGGTTQIFSAAPTGSWTIRVVQQSGYLLTPTEKTFTGVLACGGTLTASFP